MMMALTAVLCCQSCFCSCAVTRPEIKVTADKVFSLAATKYSAMGSRLSDGRFPKNYDPKADKFETSDIGWWCSGFYGGSLWYIYRYTGDNAMKDMAMGQTLKLSSLADMHTDHDIGFQIGSTYGQAYDITGDRNLLPVIEKTAAHLAERFSPVTGTIRSWDFLREGWKYPVIIDNMMNLEHLLDAAELFDCDSLRQIAVTHARTTMKNHFRDDYSSYHLVNYDPEDGHVISRETFQGFAHESMWARGEAWALYGFTMMYDRTGMTEFLTQAENIARIVLRRLPEDGIPYWDFDSDKIPDELKDASAAAIMASAFARLSSLSNDSELSVSCLDMAKKQVLRLCSEDYLSKVGENGDFLLKHSVGNIPGGTEIDVALTYADYYLLEALYRLTR